MTVPKATSHKSYILEFRVDGTLSTGDGQAWAVVPFKTGHAEEMSWAISDNGSGSSSTDVMLARVRDGSASDLFSSAPSLAHDSSSNSSQDLVDQNDTLQEGDLIRVDIDSVPGTPGSDLAVALKCSILADS